MKHCCEAFPKFLEMFSWFNYADDGSRRVMPVLKDTLYRINYCPSCGDWIRDIEIDANGGRLS
jgi:hypothetical protein